MGQIVKNTTFDIGCDDLNVNDTIKVITTKEEGIIVLKAISLYQVKLTTGANKGMVCSYTRAELERI